MNKDLIQAMYSASAAGGHLQKALKTVDGVTAIVVMPMIGEAVRIAQQLDHLIHAMADEASRQVKRRGRASVPPQRP